MNKMNYVVIILVTTLLMPFEVSGIEKIIVRDDSEATRFHVDDQGNVHMTGGYLTVDGADESAGTGPGTRLPGLSWAGTGWMNMGWGGRGGSNLEMYSQGHATRAGELRFVYGGGSYGSVRYMHYNGTGWKTNVILDKDGNVGIGQNSPIYPLEMGGGAYTDGNDWYPASSREYKENIHTLAADKAIAALRELEPVEFNYKKDKEDNHVGFIAEDVPELVATKERKGLSPMEIVAVVTSVLKEQQKVNEEQQEIISELTERVKELEKKLELKGSIAMVVTD